LLALWIWQALEPSPYNVGDGRWLGWMARAGLLYCPLES
jgi:hypothetical protein